MTYNGKNFGEEKELWRGEWVRSKRNPNDSGLRMLENKAYYVG